VLILDFWHAADHLTQLAKLLHPNDEEQRQALVAKWCHLMKHEGGQRIVDELRAYPLPRKKAVQEKHAEVVNYLSNNLHRMDYPQYLANGWMIGSGAVESACKTVGRPTAQASRHCVGESTARIRCAIYARSSKRTQPMAGILVS